MRGRVTMRLQLRGESPAQLHVERGGLAMSHAADTDEPALLHINHVLEVLARERWGARPRVCRPVIVKAAKSLP